MYNRIILSAIALTLCGWPSINLGGGAGMHDCEVLATNSWNFNDYVHIPGQNPSSFKYQGVGSQSEPMYCGPSQYSITCPTDAPNEGPFGSGAVFMDAVGTGADDWVDVALITDWRSWQNYQANNELTIAFHIKAAWSSGNRYGWFRPPLVWRLGEFWTGGDSGFAHNDRVCLNLDPVGNDPIDDAGGATGNKYTYCGTSVAATEDGLNTTLVDSIPLDEWVHVVTVFEGGASPGFSGGTYKFYIDGTLVKTETGIDGLIANSGNDIWIGNGASRFDFIKYYMDNLQIDNTAWDQDRIDQAWNCDLPG